ncbi:KCNMA1, partial [Symbiodinium pilosum]
DTRAKDLFTTITTRDGFVAANWEESQTQLARGEVAAVQFCCIGSFADANKMHVAVWRHLLLFLGLWAGLLLMSLTMGITRRIWSPDSLNKQLGLQIAVLKHSVYWNIFMFLLLLSLVVLYVLRSEKVQLDENLTFLEITAVSFYAIEAFINWFYYSSGGLDGIIRFFWNYMMVVCLVIPSVLYRSLSGQRSHFSFAFCASIRASQIYKEWVTFHRRGRIKFSDHISMYAGTFFAGAFSIGMLIRELESLDGVDPNFMNGSEPPDGINGTAYERWSLFAPWRSFTFRYLMATVLLKVLKLNEAGGLSRPKYPNRAGYRHIVITGSASLQVYLDFLHEFFHTDNASETDDVDVVILHLHGQRNVMQQLSSTLGTGESEDLRILRKIWMVEGSALKAEDLDRVRFSSASAAFLLPNLYGTDPEKEDVGNVMRALTMKRLGIEIGIYMAFKGTFDGLAGFLRQRQLVLQGLIGKAAEVQGYLPLPASLLKTSKAPGSGMARDGWPFQVQGLLIKAVIILAPLRLDYGTKSRG